MKQVMVMNGILIFFIFIALGCVGYALFRYARRPVEEGGTDFRLREENGQVRIEYRGVPFTGDVAVGLAGDGPEKKFAVRTIRLKLEAPLTSVTGWTKSDWYEIERRLYERYPEAEIIWSKPVAALFDE